eukprot:gene18471-5915_t
MLGGSLEVCEPSEEGTKTGRAQSVEAGGTRARLASAASPSIPPPAADAAQPGAAVPPRG